MRNRSQQLTCSLAAIALAVCASPVLSGEASDALSEVLRLSNWPAERLKAGLGLEDSQADLVGLALRLKRSDELLATAADEEGGEAVRVTGELSSMSFVALERELTERLGVPGFFECEVGPDAEAEAPQRVVALAAPKEAASVLPQPVSALGVMVGDVLVAPRLSWFPSSADGQVVNFGESALAGMGYDVGLLSAVADGGPLVARESHAFYSLLAKTSETGARQLARFARGALGGFAQQWASDAPESPLAVTVVAEANEGRYSVAPLFNDAVRQRGGLFVFEGVVRRAVRVEVGVGKDGQPTATAERYGLDHYFELELFTADSQNLPLVFCVRELPDGFPTGDALAQPTQLAGFFFKRWAYRTRLADPTGRGHDKRQLAPLLIGRSPVMLVDPPGGGDATGLIAGGAFVVMLLAVWWMAWRFGRESREFERRMKARFETDTPVGDFAGLKDD